MLKQMKINSKLISAIAFLVFMILSITISIHHEPWEDEARQWLVTQEAPSSMSVLSNMGYEGSPGEWFLLISSLSKNHLPYWSIQVLAEIIIGSAVLIFLVYSPFDLLTKIIFMFGYFMVYEYSVIPRSYALSVLWMFVIAWQYRSRFDRKTLHTALILLLSATNTHSLIISFFVGVVFVYEITVEKRDYLKGGIISAVLLLGYILNIIQILPPPGLKSALAQWYFTNLNIFNMIIYAGRATTAAFFPMPVQQVNFWCTTRIAFLGISLVFYAFTIYILSKDKKISFIYICSTLALIALYILKRVGTVRHHGIIFILFISSVWIVLQDKEKFKLKSIYLNLIRVMLFVHIIAAGIATYYDINYDFSAGKKVAHYIMDNHYLTENILIASFDSYATQSVNLELPINQNKTYYIEYQKYLTHVDWSNEYEQGLTINEQEILRRLNNEMKLKRTAKAIIVTNSTDKFKNTKFNLIKVFDTTIVPKETLYLYEYKT